MIPRVSLAVPVYNGENFLEDALDALCSQTFADLEIIITDNASTDSTSEICRSFAERDSRIRYVRLPRNIGAGPNFNHAFGVSRGEFFKWCAHDDLISPNFVECCIEALEREPDASLAFGRTQCINENGELITIPPRNSMWGDDLHMPPLEHDNPAARFGAAVRSAGSCFPVFGLFRAEVLDRTTLHRAYYGSDRALLAEAALLGKAILVEEAVFYRREHDRRSARVDEKLERARWQSASAPSWRSLEQVNFLFHIIEIACRHGDTVRSVEALAEVSKVVFSPKQLGRYVFDLVRFVSPRSGAWLKRLLRSDLRPRRRLQ